MPVALARRLDVEVASPVVNAAGSRFRRLWRATIWTAPHWCFAGSNGRAGMTPRSLVGSPVRTYDAVTSHALCVSSADVAPARTTCVLCAYSVNAPNDL